MHAKAIKAAGTAIFLGTGQFVFFLVVAEVTYPGYDVSSNFISDLGATCSGGDCRFLQPSSSIFDVSIALLGLALLAASYYLWKGSGSRALPVFEALAGLGAVGVGGFNESYGEAHVFFSGLTFVAGGIQAILVYKVAKPPYSAFSAMAGVVTLVATALYVTGTYLGLGAGGMERVVVYPVLISGTALGGYLMGRADAHEV
ncbi:MAG: DUF998 domain-containing protein [Nitrososphaerota archaeon]|nr:DUF998 domain-containing protein [Nitrososphaerota archaeon]